MIRHGGVGFATLGGLIMALGCGGLLPNVDDFEVSPPPTEWVGRWTGAEGTVTLHVDDLGNIEWSKETDGLETSFTCPNDQWEGEVRCIFGLNRMTIDAPPRQAEDGTWTMTLDGIELIRETAPLDVPSPEVGGEPVVAPSLEVD